MFRRKINDIPLSNEAERRHVALVVGIMVFLITVLLITGININTHFFQKDSYKRLTLEIPTNVLIKKIVPIKQEQTEEDPSMEGAVVNQENKEDQQEEIIEKRDLVKDVSDYLKSIPSVVRYQKINPEEVQTSIKKWFPVTSDLEKFNIPVFIDVDFSNTVALDMNRFVNDLENIHDRIHIQYNDRWYQVLNLFSQVLRLVAFLFMGLMSFCIILLVTLITRASLKNHKSIIEILKLIGARNRYIISIYQAHAFKSVFLGSCLGVVAAIPFMYLLSWWLKFFDISFFQFNIYSIDFLKILLFLPFLFGIVSFITARIIVLKELSKLS